MRVGVLALQGGFAAHIACLEALGHETVEVRQRAQVEACEGLVLPGGESTTQIRLLARETGFGGALDALASRAPVLATCAGLIVASERGWLDVTVRRNAYGAQRHSAEARADDGSWLVLIRAPRIERVGKEVEVLARLDGDPVLVRSGTVTGATFHPELRGDLDLHRRTFGEG